MSTHDNKSIELGWPARYQIKKELKKGALGRLFLAYDQELEKDVLIKIASPWVSEDRAFKAYVYDRWAEKETLFEHPNIANIIEVGKRTGCYFLVTECPGEYTLADELKNAPLEPDRAVTLMHQVSEALRAAHRRQIVCGHLKPSDVYISTDSAGDTVVKVMFVDMDVDARTAAGSLFGESYGIPKYMAPEVIKGKRPSPGSDIFAFGVMGYEMLTGQSPFTSEHPLGYLFANCQEDPVAPHHAVSSIPRELSMTVMRCLEKNPARRYRSAQRIIDDLDRCASIVQTGTCEIVPRGTDSALARDYDLPGKKEQKGAGASTSRLAYAAFFLAIAAALVTITINFIPFGRYVAVPAPADEEEEVDVVDGPERPADPDPEAEFAESYNRLLTKWERRYRPDRDYRQAIDEFIALARDWAGSEYAERASDQAAAVYVAWAQELKREGEFERAVEKYRDAQDIAPPNSEYEDIYYQKRPEILLARARNALEHKRYAEADELIIDNLLDRFPDTEAAREGENLLPAIILARARHERDGNETARAIESLNDLIDEYSDSEQAGEAAELLPQLHLEKIRKALESGDLAALEKHKAILAEAFTGSEESRKVEEMGAEIAFARFCSHLEAGDIGAADNALGKLLSDFPHTRQVYMAARMRAGLAPDAPEEFLDAETAAELLSDAEAAMEDYRFSEANKKLEKLVRQTAGDSREGREALWLIPECIYRDAVMAYGRGERDDFAEILEHLVETFAFTGWAETAQTTLNEFENTPEGMAYVPAGSFIMGANRKRIIDNMKPYYPEAIIGSEEELKMIFQLEGYASEIPAHRARTDSFYIDMTPVTKSQYKEFMEDAGHPSPPHWEEDKVPPELEDLPVTNIAYSEAQAYAQWAGKRLPTEIEWEKAARGVDGRTFPWGQDFEEDRAHHLRSPTAGPKPVGKYPEGKSPYGLLDMIGNVCEWTSSHFLPYEDNSAPDRRAPYGEEFLVLRSGAWDMDDTRGVPTTTTRRFPWDPEDPARFIGFRCIADCE